MISTYFLLFYEFFKIGLFAIGGGYATIPFLAHLTTLYEWFSFDELTNMIAISNMTPGPIGINMATYAGYSAANILGSLLCTFGIILAPFIITLITIYFLEKFKKSPFMDCLFQALRPVSCALLTCVMIELINKNILKNNIFDFKAILITALLFIIYPKIKKHVGIIILFGAVLGILFNRIV